MRINKRKKDDPVILTVDQFNKSNEILTVDEHNKRLSPNIKHSAFIVPLVSTGSITEDEKLIEQALKEIDEQ